MKTYQEQNLGKGSATNWHDILEAGSNKKLSNYEISRAVSKSESWVTCACGNQCSVLPRDPSGRPRDKELSRLGISFYTNVKARRWSEAKRVLARIEKRSAALIQEIEAVEYLKGLGYTVTK